MNDEQMDILGMGKAMETAIEVGMPPETKVSDIFSGDEEPSSMAAIDTLAQFIANEEKALEIIKKDHTARKDANDMAKEQLYDLIKGAGMDSVKLSCGLAPGTKLTDKFYKAAGTTDEMLFEWLKGGYLGTSIVKGILFAAGIPASGNVEQLNTQERWSVDFLCKSWPGQREQFRAADHDLSDIIKPTVHFGTMNSTLKVFVAQGGTVPEIINQVPVKGITMRGKGKYLAAKATADAVAKAVATATAAV
jgi:hypothetical protein